MLRYSIICIALIIGGWLLFDGFRALVTGSYTTPNSGNYAGQLGPWSWLVAKAGLDPTGLIVKLAHVVLGLSWIVCGLLLYRSVSLAWWPLFVTAILSLWYLPFGTIAGLTVAGLLLLPLLRQPR